MSKETGESREDLMNRREWEMLTGKSPVRDEPYAYEIGSSGPRALFTLLYKLTIDSDPIPITVDGEIIDKRENTLTIRYFHPITRDLEARIFPNITL